MPKEEFLKNPYFILIIFIAIGFIIYANSFVSPFFWDDNDVAVNNIYVKSWQYFPKYFSENVIAGSGLLSNYWRPLLLISYSLDYHFFGFNKYWWHFVNISLHILNAFLLFLILQFLIKKRWFAFFVSLVFLVHPVQTEAITMIAGRADPLSLLFVLGAILFYLRGRFVLGLIMFGLGLLTKETAIVLPALLVLTEACFPREETSFKKVFLRILPFFVLAAFYFLSRLTVLNFNNTLNFYNDTSLFATDIFVRILSFLKSLSLYYGLMIYPHNLHMERFFEPVTALSPMLIFIFTISLGALVFAFWRYKYNKLYLFGIGWFFISLAPMSNIIIPINRIFYEHWLYVPLIGFFIFLIAFFSSVFRPRHLLILAAFAAVYIIFLGVTTVKRNFDWRDPVTFFNNIIKYNNQSLLAWNNLGMSYAEKEEFEKAKRAYERAIVLDEKNQSAPPHHNLGNLYKSRGMFEEAIVEFEKAVAIDKNFFFSYNALLDLYRKTGDQKEFDKTLDRMKNLYGYQ